MALSEKYGRVTTQIGSLQDDEPVFILRARDRLAPQLLTQYRKMSQEAGSSPFHLTQIGQAQETMIGWQKAHSDIVDVPQSAGMERRITS